MSRSRRFVLLFPVVMACLLLTGCAKEESASKTDNGKKFAASKDKDDVEVVEELTQDGTPIDIETGRPVGGNPARVEADGSGAADPPSRLDENLRSAVEDATQEDPEL